MSPTLERTCNLKSRQNSKGDLVTLNLSSRVPIIEGGLILATIALALYSFFALRSDNKGFSLFKNGEPSTSAASVQWEELLKIAQPFENYSQRLETRDIFSEVAVKPVVAVESSPGPSQLQASVSHLKVSGILLGPSPEAVIEDTNLHQTFFLQVDEQQGDIIVKKIEKGKVSIEFMGQPYELKTQSQ